MTKGPHGQLLPMGGGDAIPLIREVLTVGRRESCDIPMRFPNVSGVHCILTYRNGYWHIRDEGSTNGIKVNGLRIQEKYLHPGDKITIAKRQFMIDYELLAGRQALEELEDEDIMSQPLLEKAGLAHPGVINPRQRAKNFDPGEFLLEEDQGK